MDIGNLEPIVKKSKILALGIEGSANKIGVGKLGFVIAISSFISSLYPRYSKIRR